jgi:hypothetical protein
MLWVTVNSTCTAPPPRRVVHTTPGGSRGAALRRAGATAPAPLRVTVHHRGTVPRTSSSSIAHV